MDIFLDQDLTKMHILQLFPHVSYLRHRTVSRWKGRDTEVRDIAFHITSDRSITPVRNCFFSVH